MSDGITDALLIAIYVVLAIAVAVVVVSCVLSAKHRSSDTGKVNGIRTGLIMWSTAAAVLVCLVVTYAFGSSQPVVVGGEKYSDTLWLKTAEMFIDTAAAQLIIIIVLAIALPTVCRRIMR